MTHKSDGLRRVAVVAGTSDYADLDKYLVGVDVSLRRVWSALEAYGYEPPLGGQSYLLNPTAADLEEAVTRAAEVADVLVVYYTGHGAKPAGRRFEFEVHSQPGAGGEWVRGTDLGDWTTRWDNRNRAKTQPQVMVILDTCFAGGGTAELEAATRDDIGNPNMWLIATASRTVQARQGAFARVFHTALDAMDHREPPDLDNRFHPVQLLVHAVNDGLRQGRQRVQNHPPAPEVLALADEEPPFFPNTHYFPGLRGLPLDERHWWSRLLGTDEDATMVKGSFYLTGKTGRITAVKDIAAWLDDPADHGWVVVTGGPGSGKSSLLSLPVLLSQKSSRERVRSMVTEGSILDVAATCIPDDLNITAIHARGKTANSIVIELNRAFGTHADNITELIDHLGANPPTAQRVVVVDALDESREPGVILSNLITLAGISNIKILIGSRPDRLTGTTPHRRIDLDDERYSDPEALTTYIADVSRAVHEPHVTSPYRGQPTGGASVTAVVKALGDRAGDSFLFARLLAMWARARPDVLDPAVAGWDEQIPLTVGDALDDDLDARTTDSQERARVRALLTALAWSAGNGLPRDLWIPAATALVAVSPHAMSIPSQADVDRVLNDLGSYLVSRVVSS